MHSEELKEDPTLPYPTHSNKVSLYVLVLSSPLPRFQPFIVLSISSSQVQTSLHLHVVTMMLSLRSPRSSLQIKSNSNQTIMNPCRDTRRLSLPDNVWLGAPRPYLPVQYKLVQRRMRRFSLPAEEERDCDEFVLYVDPTQKPQNRLRRRQSNLYENLAQQGSKRWENSCSSDSSSIVRRCESVGSDTDSIASNDVLLGDDKTSFFDSEKIRNLKQFSARYYRSTSQPRLVPAEVEPPRLPRRTLSNERGFSGGVPLEVVVVSPVSVAQVMALRSDHPSMPNCIPSHKQGTRSNSPPKMPLRTSICSNSSRCATSNDCSTRYAPSNAQSIESAGSGNSRTSQPETSEREWSALLADYWDEQNNLDQAAGKVQAHRHNESGAAVNYWDWTESTKDEDVIMELARYITERACRRKSGNAGCNLKSNKNQLEGLPLAADSTKEGESSASFSRAQTITADQSTPRTRRPEGGVATKVVANYWDWIVSEIPLHDKDTVSESLSSVRSRQSRINTASTLCAKAISSSARSAASQQKRDQLLYGY